MTKKSACTSLRSSLAMPKMTSAASNAGRSIYILVNSRSEIPVTASIVTNGWQEASIFAGTVELGSIGQDSVGLVFKSWLPENMSSRRPGFKRTRWWTEEMLLLQNLSSDKHSKQGICNAKTLMYAFEALWEKEWYTVTFRNYVQ